MKFHELGIFDFSQEANPLAVFPFTVGQIQLLRKFAHFFLLQVPNRKPQAAQLPLVEPRKKIGLVLYRVRRTLQQKFSRTFLNLRIMARDYFVKSLVDLVEEEPELDPEVA